ncbi:O-Antigen ligase [Hyella patelloides LEGE 07179]|uniref:O-Antigen ligase n=1 Tax=Hyella patelloides LEGE 07179 TaxID=945734 RepID=A0A563W5G4_9CYAN|nr:O-antigen ligase family protein [Hyella patelloides]VEP18895.1 O-Antigen ligase [Hyella patelloides LEGE 07179]
MLKAIDKSFRLKQEYLKSAKLSFAERVLYLTIVLTPLWWLLGIQPLFYPAVVMCLLALSFDFDKPIREPLPICAWAWLAMSLAMLVTTLIGLSSLGFELVKVASSLVTFFKGYFLIFACLALPFWNKIDSRIITRAIAWMAIGYLVVICFQLILLVAGIEIGVFYPPLARLTPGNKLSLMVRFSASLKPFFGILLPRSSLYMGDPPIPGICGLLSFFICLSEPNSRLRNLALAGSLTALIISQSRLAYVCFVISIVTNASFKSFIIRQVYLWFIASTALVCSLWEWTLSDLISKPLEIFNQARQASSTDREFVVRKTLEAWQESPWLGWGISQGTANWHTYKIQLGSFSTYAAVLYLHGIFGFIFFIVALTTTLGSFWKFAVEGNQLCQKAISSLVALYIFIQGLPLSWISVYIWFFFIWLGAVLSETQINYQSNFKRIW